MRPFFVETIMSTYIKLIQESLTDLGIEHKIVNDDVVIIEYKRFYINITEQQWNKFIMQSGTYHEYDSEDLSFSMSVYPMQYYNFKELFKMWFTGNHNTIVAYFNYRDKTDDE